jgi:hypothetical protein
MILAQNCGYSDAERTSLQTLTAGTAKDHVN